MLRAQFKTLDLLGAQLAHGLGGAADDHAAIGELLAFGHQGTRAHQAIFADDCAVQHHGPNADQRLVADGAAMQHDLVADGDVFTHHQRLAHIRM